MGGILSNLMGGGAGAGAATDEPPQFTHFHSSSRWQLHYNSLKDSSQLMVVIFSASWCGPCKFIEPAVCAMADKYTDVSFAKIDVDELKEVAQEFEVQAMPTYVLIKQGKVVDRVVGAKKDELENKIIKNRAT